MSDKREIVTGLQIDTAFQRHIDLIATALIAPSSGLEEEDVYHSYYDDENNELETSDETK